MDGVLIDVSESIQLVHGATAEKYFTILGWSNCDGLVKPSDVDAFKLAGGFNNDWDSAAAWLLLYLFKSERYKSVDGAYLRAAAPAIEEFTAELSSRGGYIDSAIAVIREMCSPEEWEAVESRWDRDGLVRLFVEVYSGDLCPEVYGFEPEHVRGPGLIRKDRPLLDSSLVPNGLKLGVATGRTGGEASAGIRLMGWGGLFEPQGVITEDDGFLKPDPRILALAVERLSIERPMYIGDNPDDLRTAKRYRESHGEMMSCMVLTGPAQSDPAVGDFFIEQQADIVADNVNAALIAVDLCMGGALCPAEKRM